MEYKSQSDRVLFGVHQLEQPTNVELSVTVTSPAMKVIGANMMVYLICCYIRTLT